jgi:hypothetical protein
MRRCIVSALFLLAAGFASCFLASAAQQSKSAVPIVVSVTDVTGAMIPHAEVKIISSQPPLSPWRKLTTDQDGKLNIDLDPGEYAISVTAPAFTTVSRRVAVEGAIPQSIAVMLQVRTGSHVEVDSIPAADHGLLLLLGQTPEPSDSSALKTCLANHPQLACMLLAITVRNQEAETVLRWSMSCGGAGVGFDLQKSDGSWEPFPNDDALPICTRNVPDVQRLLPGGSYVQPLRLADLYYPGTAIPSPDDGFIHPLHQG